MEQRSIHGIEHAKILIIDDIEANLSLLRRLLLLNGFQSIKTLSDSRQSLKVFAEYQPDIVLLDLKMPYLDGFGVLRQLKQYLMVDYLPVIMITAQDEIDNKLEALSIGAQDFIAKPFNHIEVISRIKNFLSIRLLHKTLSENNLMLENKLRIQTKELGDMQIEIIDRLLLATEFRDEETGGHIARIGNYAYMLAKKAGFSEDFVRTIFHASKLHDIGKIGISDEILLKKGAFSGDEWDVMKKHAEKGAQILSGSQSPIIKMAERIALSHHEKWDGTGYPNGLKEEDIPVEGRITAICDVFDALISWRPYKLPWSVESAIKEIEKKSGEHFDPVLAKHFIDNVEHILSFMGSESLLDASQS